MKFPEQFADGSFYFVQILGGLHGFAEVEGGYGVGAGGLHQPELASSLSNSSQTVCEGGRLTPLQQLQLQSSQSFRPRSRSLSPPRSPNPCDNELVFMNSIYRERFPNAKVQMEERLAKFIDGNKLEPEGDINSDCIARFVHHQLIELAQDCLLKSQENHLSCAYFYEMSEQLEKLTSQVKDKSPSSVACITQLVKNLLLIIARPARLLECLEFNPEEFYRCIY